MGAKVVQDFLHPLYDTHAGQLAYSIIQLDPESTGPEGVIEGMKGLGIQGGLELRGSHHHVILDRWPD